MNRQLCAGVMVFVAACSSATSLSPDASIPGNDGSVAADASTLDVLSDVNAVDVVSDVELDATADGGDALAQPTFPPGVYYVEPNDKQLGGIVRHLEGKLTIAPQLVGIGFDLNANTLVSTDNASTLRFLSPTGVLKTLPLKGLYAAVRPSLSPDGKFVAVQATETPVKPQSAPEYLTVYQVNVATGDWTRLVTANTNAMTGNELPEWFGDGQRLSHQGFDNGCNILRIIDIAGKKAPVTIGSGGPTGCFQSNAQTGARFHMTVSHDSSKILSVGQMQTFDTSSGLLLSDIRAQVLAALATAGYSVDTRYPGQGNGGTFPLDATFAPDGKSIVFDGAVEKGGTYGVVVCSINVDGTGFQVLKGPLPVNPAFSNNHNFSQVNPTWKSWIP